MDTPRAGAQQSMTREWLTGRVMTLLSHYYLPDTDPAVIRMAAVDWLDILGPYPQAAIAEACREYLRDEPKARPTPGAIRALAVKALDRDKLLAPALPPPPEAERVRCSPEAAARILDEHGMTAARLAAIAAGRRMPPPNQPGHVPPPPLPEPTVEEIVARPYTAAELARIRRNHGLPEPPGDWVPEWVPDDYAAP